MVLDCEDETTTVIIKSTLGTMCLIVKTFILLKLKASSSLWLNVLVKKILSSRMMSQEFGRGETKRWGGKK